MADLTIDLTGKRFGRLTVLCKAPRRPEEKSPRVRWECLCDCGNRTIVRSDHLRRGITKSCGCLQPEVASAYMKIHCPKPRYGESRDRIHNIWYLMNYRCNTEKCEAYKHYGGRGIKVCEEWANGDEGYFKFKEWALNNGYADDLTIDRINNNGDYEPSNCRWVNETVQANNKRGTKFVEYNGSQYTIGDLSMMSGIQYKTLWGRLDSGWDVERAISQPVRESPFRKQQHT